MSKKTAAEERFLLGSASTIKTAAALPSDVRRLAVGRGGGHVGQGRVSGVTGVTTAENLGDNWGVLESGESVGSW